MEFGGSGRGGGSVTRGGCEAEQARGGTSDEGWASDMHAGVVHGPDSTKTQLADPSPDEDASQERRRDTQEVRRSWASNEPFTLDGESVDLQSRAAAARRARWERPLQVAALIGDFTLTVLIVLATSTSLFGTLAWPHLGAAVLAGIGWVAVLASQGGYQIRRMGAGPEEFQSVLRAALLSLGVVAMTAYATQIALPRRYAFVAIPALAMVCSLYRYALRRRLHWRRTRRQSMLRTLVVGPPGRVAPVTKDLSLESYHGYDVVGVCTPYLDLESDVPSGVATLGTISDIPQVVVDHDIDVVIVTGSDLAGPALRRLGWALERAGAQLVVAPGLVEVAGPHVTLRPTAGLSLVHLETPSKHLGRGLGKAMLDRILGTLLLLVATPIIAVAALLVKLTSPGPAFFSQTRAGVGGAPFTMWKLRSMVVDAEARREELLAASDGDGLLFKMHADPRVTPVGRVLRRLSLDELPQLWNVVRGDMSLVGPRPPLMSEYENYHDAVNRRLRVKPGLTGLWQVSGRSDLSWDQSVNLDLRYVDNWSLAMDMMILWKTLRVVVFGSGAY